MLEQVVQLDVPFKYPRSRFGGNGGVLRRTVVAEAI